jgi:hypothetical protein
MKIGHILLTVLGIVIIGIIVGDKLFISKLEPQFLEIEKQRIVTSNKLATAKIVYENLNHVRELVFENMDFPGQEDSIAHETIFFEFLTTCVNDLKLKLISMKPLRPETVGLITTYSYDLELEGDFFKFGELCAKFENSRRIISLASFDVSLIEETHFSGGGRNRRTNRTASQKGSSHKGIDVKMRVHTYRVRKSADTEPGKVSTRGRKPGKRIRKKMEITNREDKRTF